MPLPVTLQQEELLDHVKLVAGELAHDVYLHNGTPIALTTPASLRALLLALRDDARTKFAVLNYLTAVDYQPKEPRFEVVYELYSIEHKGYVRIKLQLADTGSESSLPEVPTVSDIYLSANWHEREAFDLMGIRFTGHPDLRRIVLPERWDGYPLRKEYPFEGKRAWRTGTTVIDGAYNRPDDLGLPAMQDRQQMADEVGKPFADVPGGVP
jgi:NADH-quinone oxidoreductase subunit C